MKNELVEQFITFYVVVNERSVDALDDQYQLHRDAYFLVDQDYAKLPGFLQSVESGRDVMEIGSFQLCDDDGTTEDIDGKQAWSMCLTANRAVDSDLVTAMRDLVVSAYRRAAAAAAKREGQAAPASVRFVRADRRDVLRTTVDSVVEFSTTAD